MFDGARVPVPDILGEFCAVRLDRGNDVLRMPGKTQSVRIRWGVGELTYSL